jgi:hypothetical protein
VRFQQLVTEDQSLKPKTRQRSNCLPQVPRFVIVAYAPRSMVASAGTKRSAVSSGQRTGKL